MELLVIVLIAVVSSSMSGIVLYDLRDRRKTRDDFDKAKVEAQDLVRSIQTAHNSMAEQILRLQDQVTAQEMRLGLKK